MPVRIKNSTLTKTLSKSYIGGKNVVKIVAYTEYRGNNNFLSKVPTLKYLNWNAPLNPNRIPIYVPLTNLLEVTINSAGTSNTYKRLLISNYFASLAAIKNYIATAYNDANGTTITGADINNIYVKQVNVTGSTGQQAILYDNFIDDDGGSGERTTSIDKESNPYYSFYKKWFKTGTDSIYNEAWEKYGRATYPTYHKVTYGSGINRMLPSLTLYTRQRIKEGTNTYVIQTSPIKTANWTLQSVTFVFDLV